MNYQYSYYQMDTEIDGVGVCATYGIRFSCGKDCITDIRDVSTDRDTVSEIVRLPAAASTCKHAVGAYRKTKKRPTWGRF